MEIILATSNKGKLQEFNEFGKKYGIEFSIIDMPEIEENGTSFEQNSLIKARAIMQLTGKPVVADDSGLCVQCLDNGPGIYTSRYNNHLDNYYDRCIALAREVEAKNTNNDAFFVCVITLIYPDGRYYHFRGECYGKIISNPVGDAGHGYDPIFYHEDLKMTFAQAGLEKKGLVSHRAKAFKKFEEFLKNGKVQNDI